MLKSGRDTAIGFWAGLLVCSLCAPMSIFAGAPVTLNLLDGGTRSGELQTLTADGLDLVTDQGSTHVATDTVMQLDFTSAAEEEAPNPPAIAAHFADHSRLLLTDVETDGTTVTLTPAGMPAVTVAIRQLSDIRFSPLDDKITARWEELRNRNARDDLLVIRKGDVLDYVAGSLGKITKTAVTILVRDKELSAPREKIFGLVYASRAAPPQARRVTVSTLTEDLLQAEALQLVEKDLRVTTASLGQISIPVASLKGIDFGGGRIRYLADLPFDQSASKSPHEEAPVLWFVCRNATSGSGGKAPLMVGTREFRKGLWLHSGAVLRYRLNREYTQLRATAGFELTHVTRMPRFDPRVRLVILGDGKELYSKEYLWNDTPEQLEINLADVRELTIRVDSAGAAQGILEHFALGDAQVIQ